MLPERDGLDVCATLRGRDCWAPILMLTARGQVGDRIRGLNTSADDYLAKPFDFGELLARAARAGTPRSRLAPRASGGRRPGRRSLPGTRSSRAGVPVTLTAREFAILEYLARHAGQAITPLSHPRPRVAQVFRRGNKHRRRVRRLPAPQARAAVRPTPHPDDPRRRLRAGGRAMRLPYPRAHDGLVRAPARRHRRRRWAPSWSFGCAQT